MIENGEKKEEYREPKRYWLKRIFNIENNTLKIGESYPTDFSLVKFSLGYTKRKMLFELKEIAYNYGKEPWGAEKGKPYIVIFLGKRIN